MLFHSYILETPSSYTPGAAALVAWEAGPFPLPEIITSAGEDGTFAAPPGAFASWLPPGTVVDGLFVPGALADGFVSVFPGALADGFVSVLPGALADGSIVALPGPKLSVGFVADVGPPGLKDSVVSDAVLPGPIPGPLLIPGHNGRKSSDSDSAAEPDSSSVTDSDSPSPADSDSPSLADSDSPSLEASAVSVAEDSAVLPASVSFFVSAGVVAAAVVFFGIYPWSTATLPISSASVARPLTSAIFALISFTLADGS